MYYNENKEKAAYQYLHDIGISRILWITQNTPFDKISIPGIDRYFLVILLVTLS